MRRAIVGLLFLGVLSSTASADTWTNPLGVTQTLPTGWHHKEDPAHPTSGMFRNDTAGVEIWMGAKGQCDHSAWVKELSRPAYVDSTWTWVGGGSLGGHWALVVCRPNPPGVVSKLGITWLAAFATTGEADLASMSKPQRAEIERALPLFATFTEQDSSKSIEKVLADRVAKGTTDLWVGTKWTKATVPAGWLNFGVSDPFLVNLTNYKYQQYVQSAAGLVGLWLQANAEGPLRCANVPGRAIARPAKVGEEWTVTTIVDDQGVQFLHLCHEQLAYYGSDPPILAYLSLEFRPFRTVIDFKNMPADVAAQVGALAAAWTAARNAYGPPRTR